jgi:hypothetical protein
MAEKKAAREAQELEEYERQQAVCCYPIFIYYLFIRYRIITCDICCRKKNDNTNFFHVYS